jgi:chromosomal replication initiation ATPase DnaA
MSYVDIGAVVKRDHTSVINACNHVMAKRESDADFKAFTSALFAAVSPCAG